MTSSTPSPSAQELADEIEREAEKSTAGILGYVTVSVALLRQCAAILRRLSETERERDTAEKDRQTQHAAVLDEYARRLKAEAERDRLRASEEALNKALASAVCDHETRVSKLREMLAQAEAEAEHWHGLVSRADSAQFPFERRLSQKGSAS